MQTPPPAAPGKLPILFNKTILMAQPHGSQIVRSRQQLVEPLEKFHNTRSEEFHKNPVEHIKEKPAADTSSLEAEIDRLVYKLYNSTEEEIGIKNF